MQRETCVVSWRLVFTKQAQKDAQKLARAGLRLNAERLLKLLKENPFKKPPSYEKLVGDLSGAYSRRINLQHRLVYQVLKDIKTVKVIRTFDAVCLSSTRQLFTEEKRGVRDEKTYSLCCE
jgi:toxin YoeB